MMISQYHNAWPQAAISRCWYEREFDPHDWSQIIPDTLYVKIVNGFRADCCHKFDRIRAKGNVLNIEHGRLRSYILNSTN